MTTHPGIRDQRPAPGHSPASAPETNPIVHPRSRLLLALWIATTACPTPLPAQAATQPAATTVRSEQTGNASDKSPGAGAQFTFGDGKVIRVGDRGQSVVVFRVSIPSLDNQPDAVIAGWRAQCHVADRGAVGSNSAGLAVEFSDCTFLGRATAPAPSLFFQTTLSAKGMAPATSQPRLLLATVGPEGPTQVSQIVEYTLTNTPPTPVTWSIRGSGETWPFHWNGASTVHTYQVFVDNLNGPEAPLAIEACTLRDSGGYSFGPDKLTFATAAGADAKEITIPTNSTATVFLNAHSNAIWGPYGNYTGSLRFKLGTTAAPDLNLKIQASSAWIKLLGVLLTASGLAIVFYLNARLQPRLVRLQALRPCAALNEAIDDFLATTKAKIPDPTLYLTIVQCAADLKKSLQPASLDNKGFLPGPASSTPFDLAPLRSHLDSVSQHLGALVVLRNGIVQLLPATATTTPFIKQLDGAANQTTSVAAAETLVASARPSQAAAGGGRAPALSVTAIDYAIRAATEWSWIAWGLASLAVGTVWIVSNAGFGTVTDLLGCFLWGLGVTTLGAGIQNLTPAAIATQLPIKLSK